MCASYKKLNRKILQHDITILRYTSAATESENSHSLFNHTLFAEFGVRLGLGSI